MNYEMRETHERNSLITKTLSDRNDIIIYSRIMGNGEASADRNDFDINDSVVVKKIHWVAGDSPLWVLLRKLRPFSLTR
ncbi:MAG: hypothetical protein HY343_01220 [Lentisphaerae bacterium]|nr:hypothetical protein [Lentisphaerota bacterium]